MKKIFFTAMVLGMCLTACTNDDLQTETPYGHISLNVSNAPVIETRATVGADELQNWTVVVKQGDTEKFNGSANTLPGKSFAAGAYNVAAYNYATDDAAHAVNEGWGAARYEGNTDVQVVAGKTTAAEISCGKAKNSRIGVVFNESFTSAVAKDYALGVTCGERDFVFDADNAGKKAYYSAGVTVNFVLTYTFQGKDKTASGTITTVAGTEHSINVKLNTNGSISFSITYEDFTTTDEDVTIDGGSGEQVQ